MSFTPSNDLERTLVLAATDPAARPRFYRDLSVATLYVIDEDAPLPEAHGAVTLEAGRTVRLRNILHNNVPHIPVFSSLERLRAVIGEEVAYIAMAAPDLFSLVKGTPLLLNPGADYGKELTVAECDSIVDGSIWKPSERHVVKEATRVLLGQPKNYPTELAAALSRLFSSLKPVKRAWIAHFFDPSRDKHPHTLVAIEQTGRWDDIVSQAGLVARDITIPDPPIDFIEVRAGDKSEQGVARYFLVDSKPFYKRSVFGGLF
jgi:SseB protein C-terminal domain/SseB protein N-terminal domain